jgi:dTDP-glucose 4,6-dehydratase
MSTDFELHVCSRRPAQYRSDSYNWARWDITEPCELAPVYDVIIHAATTASADLNTYQPDAMYSLIVNGAENVVGFAKQHSRPPFVLFLSSGAVYGQMPSELDRFHEFPQLGSDVDLSFSAYAKGKRRAEVLFENAFLDGLFLSSCARLFAFSGVHLPLDTHFALGNFVSDAVNGSSITINGDGTAVRSYLDQRDMSSWLWEIVLQRNVSMPFHIGSDIPISMKELADLVSDRALVLLNKVVDVRILGQTRATDGTHRYVPSTTKTQEILNVQQAIGLDESIDKMITKAARA